MISRQTVLEYAANRYGVAPEYLWADKPEYAVLRHQSGGRKWFAVLMRVPAEKLGLEDGMQDIVNLKCVPAVIDGLRQSEDVLPAFHMNKKHWFSLRLNSRFPEQQLFSLMDWSFELTEGRLKKAP